MLIETDISITKKTPVGKRQDWKKANMQALRDYLQRIDWTELMAGDTESAWTAFKEVATEAVERFVPLSTCRGQNTPPWLNREIIKLIRRKKKAWRILKSYETKEARDNYVKLEKETTKKIKNAKRRLEREVARTCDDNGKKFSRYIKSKTKSKDSVGPLKLGDGKLVVEEAQMAEVLNKFFASVFTQENILNIPEPPRETEEKLL